MIKDPVELPVGTVEWIESVTAEPVASLHRHVARREAWVVEMESDCADKKSFFLRIDRAGAKGRGGPWSLLRETKIIQALAATEVPAQKIIAWHDEFHLALQEMVVGDSELDQVDRPQQHAVMMNFMAALAELHRLEPRALGLSEYCSWPESAEQQALSEVYVIENLWRTMPAPASAGRLFSAFGRRWLENHVPPHYQHTVLVQGDTGPANFMFDGDKISASVDWELAHFGDPMEDLGNIVVRDYFYPSSGGDLQPYFSHYEQLSGIPFDVEKVKYYTVQQLLRSVMSLMYSVPSLKWNDEVAMNMGYEINCQRAMCDAIARAMAVSCPADPMPESVVQRGDEDKEVGQVFSIIEQQLQQQILPAQSDHFITHRVEHIHAMVEFMHRKARYGAHLDRYEQNEIADIMGKSFDDLPMAEEALLARIDTLDSVEEEQIILNYLHARAYRLEHLMEPLVRPFAHRFLAKVD